MTDEHDWHPGPGNGGSESLLDLRASSTEPGESPRPAPRGGARRARRKRSVPGCLAALVALVVVVAGFYVAVTWGVDKIRDQFSSAADYAGPGTGRVMFQVHPGDSATTIGRNLKADDVVASVDAFIQAAEADPDSSKIQAGTYALKKQMGASEALDVLVDPSNIVSNTVTIPEGLRVVDIVAILADKTNHPKAEFEQVLQHPGTLGLPAYAHGKPEGYLFPATYDFGPKDTPKQMLTDMVDRWKQAAQSVDLVGAARQLGYSPGQLMTVASLVEAEGRGNDMPKIARVVYNRLQGDETNHLLQIDATVNYAAGNDLGAVPTTTDLQIDSPYNTYKNPGLPPTPIEAPGEAALRAATHPASGDWYYYVTVNLRTGETKFARTYAQFLRYKDELRRYCETQSAGAC